MQIWKNFIIRKKNSIFQRFKQKAVEDKKEESDGGLDLVADECLDLSKNRSKLYKQERNDIEMQDESVMNTNSI